jgi:phosphatidyl-myo-inositol dimannoside synthase
MRILLITWNYPPKIGGMEMMLYQLVQHLPRSFDVDVLVPGKEIPSDLPERANVIHTNNTSIWGFYVSAFKRGRQLLAKRHHDLIVAGSALVTPVVYVLGRQLSMKTAVHVYGLDVIFPRAGYQFLVRLFLRRIQCVMAISKASRQEAIDRGVDPARIAVLTPGVSAAEFELRPNTQELKQHHGLHGKQVILYAGRLARRKGVLEFVSFCLPEIVRRLPHVVLVVAGGNADQSLSHSGDMESQIAEEARRRNLADNVRLLGRIKRDELVGLFHACDLLLLPAIPVPGDMEGFGIVLLEASAAGRPVVATRLGGIPDAVIEGVTGILVEAGSWPDFTDAVVNLLENEDLADRLGRAGRDRAIEHFDWSVIGRCYADLLSLCAAR